MNRTYGQLSEFERHMIAEYLKLEVSLREIATALKRSPSTNSREIRRNAHRGHYRFSAAHDKALKRRHAPKGTLFSQVELRNRQHRDLARKWSPDQVAGRWKVEEVASVSRSTIYRYLKGKPKWRRWLRGPTEKRRRDSKRERIHNPRWIDERPEEVAERSRCGDWEADTIRGPMLSPACVATFVERKTRFLVARKLPAVSSEALNAEARKGLRGLEVRTLTVDNGMEFGGFKKLERLVGTTVYFGHPHCPWERGLNENTNGLLRQYFPKGTDFTQVAVDVLNCAVAELNERPRKCLNYLTPREALDSARCT